MKQDTRLRMAGWIMIGGFLLTILAWAVAAIYGGP
jgi:hypothetical protein